MNSKKIIVALDSNNLNKIIKLVKILKKDVFAFKIGFATFLWIIIKPNDYSVFNKTKYFIYIPDTL